MKTKLAFIVIVSLGLMSCAMFDQLAAKDSPDKKPSAPTAIQWEPATPVGIGASQGGDAENTWSLPGGGRLLPNPAAGLDGLNSYHQELSVAFEGSAGGKTYAWTNTYARDFWKDPAAAEEPPASFLLIKTSETGQEASERLTGSLDQAQYQRGKAGGPCQVTWEKAGQSAETGPNPASLLPPVQSASETPGQEAVNGIASWRYLINFRSDWGWLSGEVWIAADGGFVTRYRATRMGAEKMFGKGIEGKQTYTYELSQVNALARPVPPEGCAAADSGLPVMKDAQQVNRRPKGVNYTSPSGMEAISQFYLDQMKQEKWNLISNHKSSEKKWVLIFVNEEKKQTATILLDGSDGKGVWVSAVLR